MSYTSSSTKRVRTRTLTRFKNEGRKITMLTSYDSTTASIFDEAGIDILLVGDSAGNTVLGYESTVSTRQEDIVRFTGAVARSSRRALILADLAFGTYQGGPQEALRNAVELMQAGAHAVKLEGGREILPQVSMLIGAGIPVCAHLGFTPQSVNQFGGHRVQGRNEADAEKLLEDVKALEEAGCFAVVLEMVPAALAARVTQTVTTMPTIGIGAGVECDGQVLVWQDMAGLSDFDAKFVRKFGNLREELVKATTDYRDAVTSTEFPAPEHSFE